MSGRVISGVTEAAIEAGVKQLGMKKIFANTNMNFWDDLISSATTAGLKAAGAGAAIGGIRGVATGEGFLEGAAHGAIWGGVLGTAGGLNARMNEHLRGTYGKAIAGDGGFALGTAGRIQRKLKTEAAAKHASSQVLRSSRAKIYEENFDRTLQKFIAGGAKGNTDRLRRYAEHISWNSPDVGVRNQILSNISKNTAEALKQGGIEASRINDIVNQIVGGIRVGGMT